MANYVGVLRSSYALIKDEEAFREFCKKRNLRVITDQLPGRAKLHGFLLDEGEEVNKVMDEEDFFDKLAEHLVEGWAIEVREIGRDGLSYFFGVSTVVLWDKRKHIVELSMAQVEAESRFGKFSATAPEY